MLGNVRCGVLLATLFILAGILAARSPMAHAAGSTALDLSGPWLYQSGDDPSRRNAEVVEAGWQTLTLPGASVPAGFSWYRKHFVLPSEWQTDPSLTKYGRLYLHLGALHGAATVYINGFEINRLGTLPNAAGAGFKAVAPSSDVTVIVPISAQVSGGGVQTLFHWGADNVVAVRLYDTTAGPNPSGGDMSIDLPVPAQLYPVTCTTAQADHLFDPKNPVVFTATFTNTTSTAAPLVWSTNILDESGAPLPGYQPQSTSGDIDPGGSTSYGSNLSFGDRPGIFTFEVESKIAGVQIPAADFVAGWNVDKIHSDQTEPAGFAEFWAGVAAEAAKGDLGAHATADTALSAADVNVYRVHFNGIGPVPALAWLSVPKHLSSDPIVILHIPAYDSDAVAPDTALASQGFVVMDMMVTAPRLGAGNAGQSYMTEGIDDPNTYIFRDVVGRILRAARLLRSGSIAGVPTQQRLVLWGESQGGGLALMAAGLLKQDVSAVVAISPYFSDTAHTLDTVLPANNPFAGYIADHQANQLSVNRTLAFYDTMFFGPMITAPVFFGIGLRDPITPPFSEFAALNTIAAPHTLDVEPDAGHVPAESEAKAAQWLQTTLR